MAKVHDIKHLELKIAEFEAAPEKSLRRDFLLSALLGDIRDLGMDPTPELLIEAGVSASMVWAHWDAACNMLQAR